MEKEAAAASGHVKYVMGGGGWMAFANGQMGMHMAGRGDDMMIINLKKQKKHRNETPLFGKVKGVSEVDCLTTWPTAPTHF